MPPSSKGIAATVVLPLMMAFVACATRTTPVRAPVELAIAPVDGGGIDTTGPSAPHGECSVRLLSGRIDKSSRGCYLDEQISENPGLLRFPCSGDGPAEADFGQHRYTGRVTAGEVELELTTELDWEDGCHWGTRAVISGEIVSRGEPTLKPLEWRYKDHIITGSGCSGLCTAKSVMQVRSTTGRTSPTPDDEEEEEEMDD